MSTDCRTSTTWHLRPLGGPTVVLEMAGIRFVVDPTFDEPGIYPIGERFLEKTSSTAAQPDELGHIDYVLLSHDQHPDNLDTRGRELVARTPTFTTIAAAARLGPTACALPTWTSVTIESPRSS